MDKLYVIYCGTGCTCCNYENHYRGFYKTRDDAQKRIDYFLDPNATHNPVGSQYARKGHYSISEVKVELISDDRMIIDYKHVFNIDKIREINENGSINGDDQLYGMGD